MHRNMWPDFPPDGEEKGEGRKVKRGDYGAVVIKSYLITHETQSVWGCVCLVRLTFVRK